MADTQLTQVCPVCSEDYVPVRQRQVVCSKSSCQLERNRQNTAKSMSRACGGCGVVRRVNAEKKAAEIYLCRKCSQRARLQAHWIMCKVCIQPVFGGRTTHDECSGAVKRAAFQLGMSVEYVRRQIKRINKEAAKRRLELSRKQIIDFLVQTEGLTI